MNKNWDRSRAIPFLGIFVSNFRYCVLQCRSQRYRILHVLYCIYTCSVFATYENTGYTVADLVNRYVAAQTPIGVVFVPVYLHPGGGGGCRNF
jgi:hypothetical protein